MPPRCGESSSGPPSQGPLFLRFAADPTASTYMIVEVTLSNGKSGRGRVCKQCGRVIAIGTKGSPCAYTSHADSCKGVKVKKRSSPGSQAAKPADRARSLSVNPSTTSSSPLIIPSPSTTPSPSECPTSPSILSPTYSPISTTFDLQDGGSVAELELPPISVNPPSDDMDSLYIPAALSPSSPSRSAPCTGITVNWERGTI